MGLSGQEAKEDGFEYEVTCPWIGTLKTFGDTGLDDFVMDLSGPEANDDSFDCEFTCPWTGTLRVGDKGLDDLEMDLSGYKANEQGLVWGVSRLWIETSVIVDKGVFGFGFLFSKNWEFVDKKGDERSLSENNSIMHDHIKNMSLKINDLNFGIKKDKLDLKHHFCKQNFY